MSSAFSKQIPKSHHHHNSHDSSQGHHSSLAQGSRAGGCCRVAWAPQSGEAEDAGTGLAALLGAFPSGAGSPPKGPSEPSFSFLVLELLGSGCPVCEGTCRTIIRLFFILFVVLFPFAAPLCNYALYFITFVLGRCLWLFNLGVGGLGGHKWRKFLHGSF